ncbi:histone deacetylase [Exophiala xenobiotica]|uniref:Histone deacetylase n=1 Tax=Lithohypha guttulata TaxID=1690604 RepID=A0ABR0KFH7_9EURO|nr:histone deacetylase [Lithohypha guttulata]KAK5316931.1 histone deacetylase [Exophiala xenobiotica]
MDLDPDIALPSIESLESVDGSAAGATTPQSERFKNGKVNENVSSRTTKARLDSSPARSPFKTPSSRPPTPSSRSISRSPSAVSVRHDRSVTPRLERKTSTPNLSVRTAAPHQPQFRRASSNLNPATPLKTRLMERPQMTPTSVAKDYFSKELQAHSRTGSNVVVFTHDACYGHRFARPRSTKAVLGSIVERPERIHATLLGASAAYVRLGQRHKDGKHGPHPDREPATPPFALIKSSRSMPLTNPAVTAVHGTKWMDSLQVMCGSAEAKLAMGQKELARPIGHQRDAKGTILPPLHSGDLYLSAESLSALQGCLGGVCDAVDVVFQPDATARRAFVCIRPPGHHCSADLPSGFCWLNNVHIGITYAAMNHGLTHAAIIDFDLHHGDGSQTITWDHNRDAYNIQNPKSAPSHKKTPIGYYSLHDINSYPCEYGDEDKIRNASTCLHTAHGQSIWNVHLESWRTHADFWKLYEAKYKILLEKATIFLRHHSHTLRQTGVEPKAAVFLSSGFDASEWESPGMQRHQVNVPTDFYAKFTSDVVDMSRQADLGVDGRIISVLEGGYSDRALTSGVMSHLCGLTQHTVPGTALEPTCGLSNVDVDSSTHTRPTYDPEWWQLEQLESLEAVVAGHTPQPTKPKDKLPSSFASPTRASTARMTEVAKERQSLSQQMEARLWLENAPPEPVPDVDWVTAAYELSRLLIPKDRQTESCTHEELNAENSRVRRDRQSLVSLPISDIIEDKMQLRDRKPKKTNPNVVPTKPAAKNTSRRTTIAAASELPDPSALEPPRTRRRSSAASSVLSGLHDLQLNDKEGSSSTRTFSRDVFTAPSNSEAVVAVRKTRAHVKKPASTANSPRKKTAAAPNSRARAANEPNTSRAATTSSATSTNADVMDDLTNGMKKISIKLKLPTEEQHKANQRQAEEATTDKPKPARRPPVPRAPKTKAVAAVKADATAAPSPSTAAPVSRDAGSAFSSAEVTPPATAVARVDSEEQTSSHQSQTNPLDLSQQRHVTTMSPLTFLSVTEPQAAPALDRQDVVPDVQGSATNTDAINTNPEQAADTISYPSIKIASESPPVSEDLINEEQSAKSIWDIPETPHR